MRLIRLAPCAVFLSSLAPAQTVERPTTSGGNATGNPAAAVGTISGNPLTPLGGAALSPGLGLQGALGAQGAQVTINPAVSAAPAAALPAPAIGATAAPAKAVPAKSAPARPAAVAPAAPAGAAAPAAASQDAKSAPSAGTALDSAARGIAAGRERDAEGGGDGLSVRRALDRAYDSAAGAGDVAANGGVSGRFATAREKIASLVGVANVSAPADAPGLYRSALDAAKESLPASAAEAVSKAVRGFAERKAEVSLSELVQSAYASASAGQSGETRRLVKSLDAWESLLGTSQRPLISNGARLKSDVERVLAEASKPGAGRGSAPRAWVVKRGGSYAAALPGSPVEKVPGLAATFALKLEKLAPSPVADAYRAFAARPGLRTAISARVALGDSVPAAAAGTFWTWLKTMALRAWNGLLSLLPGRGLPAVADAATTPRLRAAASSWREATASGEAAARAAGAPRPTVSRARAAFALARRAAAAHEALTRETGASERVESLAASFESGVKLARLSPSDRLTPALEEFLAGDGGLRHWAARYAADARERGTASFSRVRGETPVVTLAAGPAALAAPLLAAASRGDLGVVAYGDALWASGSGRYGAAKLSADLRATEAGGSVALETERGDEGLARELDALGFKVVRAGRGLSARLDAETAQADARDMAALAADGAALMTGGAPARSASPEGLERLLADVKSAPAKAEKAAAALDGRSTLARARTVAWVGELEAVAAELPSRGERVIALRDPATGLPKYARVEPIRTR